MKLQSAKSDLHVVVERLHVGNAQVFIEFCLESFQWLEVRHSGFQFRLVDLRGEMVAIVNNWVNYKQGELSRLSLDYPSSILWKFWIKQFIKEIKN